MSMRNARWRRHPGVRTGVSLTRGERAADRMRNGMGSWGFVFAALAFLALWMAANASVVRFDRYPFILLNLVLSCLAAMQGAILLIAAKRSDQVSSELAVHDFEQDTLSREMLETLTKEFVELRRQHIEQGQRLDDLIRLATEPGPEGNTAAVLLRDGVDNRVLALLLNRLGGTVELSEVEIGEMDRDALVVATQNRIAGSVTMEYRSRK